MLCTNYLLVACWFYLTLHDSQIRYFKVNQSETFYRLDRMRQVGTLYTTKFDNLEQEFEITTDHKI